jgi:uncharacterized YkwD family protein
MVMKNKILAILMVCTLLFTASCTQRNQQTKKQKQPAIGGIESSSFQVADVKNIKITADTSNIKAGCSNNAPVVQSSGKDSKFDVISEVSDWYALKLPNNNIGFVSKQDCKPIVAENNKTNIPPQDTAAVPQGTTAPKTPATKTNSSTLTASEQEMLKLLNASRVQNKLAPLIVDLELTNVARIKAQDMIDNNYFSHNSPKYGNPFDMMKSFGVNYLQAGENIAGNQSVQNAQNALMNSPGHRKNILSPDFTHIGLGIQKGGPYGNMFSQMFISKPQ